MALRGFSRFHFSFTTAKIDNFLQTYHIPPHKLAQVLALQQVLRKLREIENQL